jgi:hypothetical protein
VPGIAVIFARRTVAIASIMLIAAAGSLAFAAPAQAGDNPVWTVYPSTPGTGSVSLQLPESTDVVYGQQLTIPVTATCVNPFANNGIPNFNIVTAQEWDSAIPNPMDQINWTGNTYSGHYTVTITSSITELRFGVGGADCFPEIPARSLMTLTADQASAPQSDAPWVHTSLSAAKFGRAFSDHVSGPATDTYTYAVTSGALPTGLALASDGTVTGSTTVVGNYSVTVTASDSGGGQWVHTVSGTVTPEAAWQKSVVATATNGRAYSDSVAGPDYGSGYTSQSAYAITGGELPTGLSLNYDGSFYGTPDDTAGDYQVTVTATDDAGHSYSTPVTVTLVDGTPANAPWVNATIPDIEYNRTISLQLAGPAGGDYTYSYSGYYPDDLNFYDSGAITGATTAAPGTYVVDVTATDEWGGTWTAPITYTILPEKPWVKPTVAAATVGTPYSDHVVAPDNGTTWTYQFTFLGSGEAVAPAWVTTTPDGTISGTPDVAQSITLKVRATDPDHDSFTTYQTFVVNPFVPVWSSTTIAPQYPGIPSTASVSASGDHVTYSIATGSLPIGLTLNADGTISGSPVLVGPYDVTIRAEQDGETSDQEFTGSVLPPSATLTLDFTVGSTDLTLAADAVGLAPGSAWSLVLHSTPTTIASGAVTADGTVFSVAAIPAGTPAGPHELIFSGVSPSGVPVTAHAWFTLGRNGTILAVSLIGPTPALASLAATGAPDVDGAMLVGLLGMIAGAGILIVRRRRRA